MSLSKKHDSYQNKQALQNGVRGTKKKEVPAGLQWNGNGQNFVLIFSILMTVATAGIVDWYDKDLKDLKPEEQYIWHL